MLKQAVRRKYTCSIYSKLRDT